MVDSLYNIATKQVAYSIPEINIDTLPEHMQIDVLNCKYQRAESIGRKFFFVHKEERQNSYATLSTRQHEAYKSFVNAVSNQLFNLHYYDNEINAKETFEALFSECLFNIGRSKSIHPDIIVAHFLNKKFCINNLELSMQIIHIAKGLELIEELYSKLSTND
jgi:hypothetical protein